MTTSKKGPKHIVLTSHPGAAGEHPTPINWGAPTAAERGPVIGTLTDPKHRNCIGSHGGAYTVYRALAVAAGALDPFHIPDLTNTSPPDIIGPHPSWADPDKFVSIDPWGAIVSEVFKDYFEKGFHISPTIAITRAHITMLELLEAIREGRLKPDGEVLGAAGDCKVTKAALDPVWYLPGVAKRFQIDENSLRRSLFQHTGGMYPELVTRPDLKLFLPPIGGQTIYIFGDASLLGKPDTRVTARVHDECNGSDVFGSDICTCRPYLVHGIEECVLEAQRGGVGIILYNRKEGRALGEVTKFLVYNARKRQVGGDTAAQYFARTECVAGVQDMRFQELMPDALHWLGLTKIDRLVSMSDMKYNAITKSGISVGERVSIPDDRIPKDAQVEMDAKRAAGYFSEKAVPTAEDLEATKGRGLDE